MIPPPDFLNTLYALKNNIKEIHFSSTLDPIITPNVPLLEEFPRDVVSYIDFFENADPGQSSEPLIVEYYKIKFKLKSFEEILMEIEGQEQKPTSLPLEINDFISNGSSTDLYLAPFYFGKILENELEEKALRFFEEAYKIAMRCCNKNGAFVSLAKIKKLKQKTGTEP